MKNIIVDVEKNSIAYELGVKKGDILISVNGKKINDIFDYRYLIKDEYVELLIQAEDEEVLFEIEKDEDEDIGIDFENPLMDNPKSCKNKCIFCFIDQLPKNMRETLYFKDDDSRLSFLQGNYITLTNMKDTDIDRIIYYHLSPINISVHSTDPELRYFMLKNPNAKKIMNRIKRLHEARIELNFQVVLCKDVNDKENLDRTIRELSEFLPSAKSLSVVPVGLSNHRENLYELSPFTKGDSRETVKQIEKYQNELFEKYNKRFVYASDEFYINGELPLPAYENYEDFPQLENGVGMTVLFREEFYNYLGKIEKSDIKRKISVVTGALAYDFIMEYVKVLMEKFPNIEIKVFKVINKFFGERITVSGLLTGRDIISTLENSDLGEQILIPENTLKSGEKVFLDDVSVIDLVKILNTPVIPVKIDGKEFIKKILE